MKKTTTLIIILLFSFFKLKAQPHLQGLPGGNTTLSGGCMGMVMFYPKNSWACAGTDSVFFVTAAWNYNFVRWQKSSDSGLTWENATPAISTLFNDNYTDTFFINVHDSAAMSCLYRTYWEGSPCPAKYSPPVKVIPYTPNTAIWTGYSGDYKWDNYKNWLCGKIPGETTDVIIQETGVIDVINNTRIRSLHITGDLLLNVKPGVSLDILH